MIRTVDSYQAECDVCKKEYEQEFTGYAVFGDEQWLEDSMIDEGWRIGDGHEGEAQKVYCPDCWYYNDDDLFIIKPSEEKP